MNENKCICVCLIPALISFDFLFMFIGHFAPAVFDAFVASSSLVEGWGHDKGSHDQFAHDTRWGKEEGNCMDWE